MNKRIFKKILTDFLTFFAIAILSSSLIVWVFQSVNFFEIIIEDGKSYFTYLSYSFLNFPKIVSKLSPFVLFFSFFFVLSKYEEKNELLIFWSIGINKINLIYFFFYFSLILMIIQMILNSLIVPNTLKYSRQLINNSNVNLFEGFIKPKKFNDTIKNLTIYTENKEQNQDLKNIFIKKKININDFQITYAKTGKLKIGLNNTLELFDGETINYVNNNITKFTFQKSDFSLDNLESNAVNYIKLQETPTLVFFSCLNNLFKRGIIFLENINSEGYALDCSINSLENIFKELYKRFIIPMYIPVLFLITLFLINHSKQEKNYTKIKFFVFLINFFVIIISETSIKFVSGSLKENYLLIIIPLLFIIILLINFFYHFKLKFKIET